MTHKIYRGDGTLLLRMYQPDGSAVDVEFPEDEALGLADAVIALLRPAPTPIVRIAWTPEMDETLRRMYVDEGKGETEIAKTLGATPAAVAFRRGAYLGIPAHDQEKAEAARARINARHAARKVLPRKTQRKTKP